MQIPKEYLTLSKTRKSLILNSLFYTFLIRISLYFLSFSRINAYNKKYYRFGKNNGEKVEDILWSVEMASNFVPRATCLTSAMAGQIMLSKYDYPSTLKIGVKKVDDFEAHAWLEMDNEIVLGKLDTDYVPLINLDSLKS